jgi:hypothetical protein
MSIPLEVTKDNGLEMDQSFCLCNGNKKQLSVFPVWLVGTPGIFMPAIKE